MDVGGPFDRGMAIQAFLMVLYGAVPCTLFILITVGQKTILATGIALFSFFLAPAVVNAYRLTRYFRKLDDMSPRIYNIVGLGWMGLSVLVAILLPEGLSFRW